MKVLILFFAIAVLNVSFIVYQSDMNSYIRENTYIKQTAEECASGASLFYDEESLSEGFYVFDREECEKYVRYIIGKNFPDTSEISYKIIYHDAAGTDKPAIEVEISVGGKDRFRLAFLHRDVITRAAYYEHSGY